MILRLHCTLQDPKKSILLWKFGEEVEPLVRNNKYFAVSGWLQGSCEGVRDGRRMYE